MKETSRFVRFHSMQAIILWITSILISIVLRVFLMIPFIGLLVIPIWMLVALRRLPLGRVQDSVPRYIQSSGRDGWTVLVSTVLPGTPMSVGYHH